VEIKSDDKIRFQESYLLFGIEQTEAADLFRKNFFRSKNVDVIVTDENGELEVVFLTSEQKYLSRIRKHFQSTFKNYILSVPNKELEEIFFDAIQHKKAIVSTAESVTGGMIASRILNQPGASEILKEAFIVYSNDSKRKILGVSKENLEKYGSVSEEVAREMAMKLKEKSKASIIITSTGVAGPSGGSEANPVGTVYFGFLLDDSCTVVKKVFSGHRMAVRKKATAFALAYIIDYLRKRG